MNTLLRNFFYAVGLVTIFGLYSLDPAQATFGDLVRMTQSENVQHLVGIVTIVLIAIEFLFRGTSTSGITAASVSSAVCLTSTNSPNKVDGLSGAAQHHQ